MIVSFNSNFTDWNKILDLEKCLALEAKPLQGTFTSFHFYSFFDSGIFIQLHINTQEIVVIWFLRYELLSMVKKHSNLIGKTVVEDQDAPDVEMDMKFWHDVFDLYFLRGNDSRGRQDDDLVFFVRKLV